MIEQDTIKLLRECDAGIKMGVSAIDEVLDYAKSERLKKILEDCKDEHKDWTKNCKSYSTDTRTTEKSQTQWQRECRG